MRPLRAVLLNSERIRRRLRAWRKSLGLRAEAVRVHDAPPGAVILFAVFRNEARRIPEFLAWYRRLGVGHFCFVDNQSGDGGGELIRGEPDCSLWRAAGSYAGANYGIDWLNHLMSRHAHRRWVLVADLDEYLTYPHDDTRDLSALTFWLASRGLDSMAAMQLDVYPDAEGRGRWFDTGNYFYQINGRYRNLWIRGGPRLRIHFADQPDEAPALNKTPLVHWRRRYVFRSSTHVLLPTRLNVTYGTDGTEPLSGCLIHTKLTEELAERAGAEVARGEHYKRGREYRRYQSRSGAFWTPWSARFQDWRSLTEAGLMSRGDWL
jgi:hypothetical protein